MQNTRALTSQITRTLAFAALLLGRFISVGSAQETESSSNANSQKAAVLIEGDVILISFPAAPDLNTSQKIRRDGRITLPLIGEVEVSGLTPTELETALLALYDQQLVTKEVSVTVTSSSWTFYVNGAVLSPGKQVSDRRLTALEAIMEAGDPSPSANLKKNTIIRQEGDKRTTHKLNMKDVLAGKKKNVFYIQPSDIITIPEKFVIF
jgi:polysaccharide export outer membrane protein|tara:strand:+ start:202 stop:825 length:624 start_codon:yes stop_codon:yes gene_type:complete